MTLGHCLRRDGPRAGESGPDLEGIEANATSSLIVPPAGPRQGEAGSRYLNIESLKNKRYARFGVLAFELSKGGGQAGDVKTMSLRLDQSVPRFAKDGKVRFFLAEPQHRAADPLAGLRFDPKSPSGVGKDEFKALHPLGFGSFTKVETGHADTFELKPDEAGQRYLAIG